MDQLRNMNDRNALHVLPKEVWEIIMENLYTHEDMKSLLKAFPEVSALPKSQPFAWLIGDVMPLIMSKFLSVDDIFSCRLVSKRWRNSVRTSLEAQPDRLPYNSTRQTLISEHHINYSPIFISTNLRKFLNSGYEYIARDPVNENPFPARSVNVKFVLSDSPKERYYLSQLLYVLEVFGHHVWYFILQFIIEDDYNEETFFTKGLMPLFECLSHLPNLLSLEISGPFDYGYRQQTGASEMKCNGPVAELPLRLESLNITKLFSFSEDICSIIVNTAGWSRRIQKLEISADMWKKDYATLFPNLTEIFVDGDSSKALKMLGDLQAPLLLRKLKMTCEKLNICHLLKTLADYKCQVESVEIDGGTHLIDSTWDHSTVFPAVHDLKLKTCGEITNLKFGFLKALPNLKYLTLDLGMYWDFERFRREDSGDTTWNIDEYETHQKTAITVSLYRFHVRNRKEWNTFSVLWELLPKLEILTIVDNGDLLNYRYARECKGNVFKSPPYIVSLHLDDVDDEIAIG